MRLFIRLQNGEPFEHPISEENMQQAYPNVDLNNLPNTFAEFIRHPQPSIGVYEVYENTSYEWVDGKVQDVHHVRQMTQEEKIDRQDRVKNSWAQNTGYLSWIFNEVTCKFEPPIPYPNDGKQYGWDEDTTSWIELA
jgi:hypothetical protein